METDGRPFQVRTARPVRDDVVPRQPNEVDESADSQESGSRSDMLQAYEDVVSGLQDTDCHGLRGVEDVVRKSGDQASSGSSAGDRAAGDRGRKK